jgi:hypothetical protein
MADDRLLYDSLSFGEPYPGAVYPLDGVTKVAEQRTYRTTCRFFFRHFHSLIL